MLKSRSARGMILGASLLAAPSLHAQTNPDWTTPIAPFHTVLVAHKTAGHTRGCTTWTMQVKEAGRPLNVVIVGSWNVNPGWRLVDRPDQPASYPGIAADYRRTFTTLKGLPCDIFLGAHGEYFAMLAKLHRIRAGGNETVWIDPAGYQAAVAGREQAFVAD